MGIIGVRQTSIKFSGEYDQTIEPLYCLELQRRKLVAACPRSNPKKFDSDYASFAVEIKDYSRPHLFRLDDFAFVQTEIKGIVFFINSQSHFLPRNLLSKKAVTALLGVADTFIITRSHLLPYSGIRRKKCFVPSSRSSVFSGLARELFIYAIGMARSLSIIRKCRVY